jgi:DNA invertase Pin-like site-specific DNA recombinase
VRGGQRGAAAGRVWGYCRVSSPRQERDGTSLEGQQQTIARWVAAEKLPPATFFIEGESGTIEKAERRAEQRAIMAGAKAGDVVVTFAVDRWSRDLVYTMQSVRDLTKRGVRWYAIREALDATTREGDDRLGLMAWIAENERKRIKERTLGRKAELADDGFYVRGLAPIGYALVDRRLVPGPERAIVIEAFERCARGEGLQAIGNTLPLTKGRKTWDKAAVHRILRNRHYLGESERSDGTWHPTHEALVDRDLWERAHAALKARKATGRIPGDGWSAQRLLRGLAVCAKCGCKMAVALGRQRLGDSGRSMAYVCNGYVEGRCKVRQVHAERLDALVDHAALERLKELRHELAKARPREAPSPPPPDHSAKLAAAKRRRERLITAFADGTLTKADLRDRIDKLDAEIAKLQTASAKVRRLKAAAERAARPEARMELLARIDALTAAWQRAPVGERRQVLALLVERIEVTPAPRALVHDVVAPRIRWRSVADLLAEA